MHGRKLQYYGSAALRRKSRELDIPSEKEYLENLLSDMFRILSVERGLGLAAPQAGENVRVFILNSRELSLGDHSVFINPAVVLSGAQEKDEEGCLSIPGVFEPVRRPLRVELTAFDREGKQITLDLEGYAARAVQHETDHLNGVLFIDKLSPIRKRLIKKQLIEIKREYGQGDRIF